MPSAYKILGQSAPNNVNDTLLYAPPGTATQAVISSIVVCNRSAAATTFRIRLASLNSAVANAQWLFYDAPLPANTTVVLTGGITLGSYPGGTDTLYCQSAGFPNVTFQVFGQEIT